MTQEQTAVRGIRAALTSQITEVSHFPPSELLMVIDDFSAVFVL